MAHNVLVVIIPTRNRSELAFNAINSVLSQAGLEVRIFISDNSTSETEVAKLRKFCEELNNKYIHYLRPPESLSMTKHYEWAVRQALAHTWATHFLLLTDRMIFLDGRFAEVINAWRPYPTKIFSYGHNRLVDDITPVHLEQCAWTGQTIELYAARLLRLSSQMILHVSLPRMMNCIAPREVFEHLEKRYGNLFDSIAPDFNFCYRSLAMYDSIVYYDAYPLLHYALDRSNGQSQVRGIATKDHVDFIANLGGKTFNYAAPVPDIMTVGNAIIHEYCFVRQEVHSDPKLPPVDREKYLQQMAVEVEALENPELRDKMRILLSKEGWTGPPTRRSFVERLQEKSFGAIVGKIFSALRSRGWSFLTAGRTRRFWKTVIRWFGIYPPTDVVIIEFATRAAAIDFANRHPRPRQTSTPSLDGLRGVH